MALLATHPPDVVQLALELQQAALDLAAVGLELGFARSAGPDASAQLGHGGAAPGQPGQHVFQLRQLYLQLPFAAARVAGKDVENQLGAIDYTYGKRTLQVSLLGGGKVVIEENEGSLRRRSDSGDLFHLALAHKRGRVRPGPPLLHFAYDLRSGAGNQLAKLGESVSTAVRRLGSFVASRGEPGSLARHGGRTRQRRLPGDECDADQERSLYPNSGFLMLQAASLRLPRPQGASQVRVHFRGMPYARNRTMIAVQHRTRAYDRRDGVLENQLLLTVVFQQHRILVERTYFACEFDPADQVYRDRGFIFADRIKKRVLNVLCRLIVHVPISNSCNGSKLRYGKAQACNYFSVLC